MQVDSKYSEYTIENFIHIIVQENLKKEELVARIRNTDTNEELCNKTLQKVDFAYKRIEKPLENNIKILSFIFPFSIIDGHKSFFNVEENRKLGFVRKIKEYHKYSFIGLIIYVTIIILVIIFF